MRPATVERILAAAQRLFAEHGYAGTSIRDITRQARANLGAVTYHFETKEKLYHQVIERLAEPLAARAVDAAANPGTPLERIERFTDAFFQHINEHPDFPRFMVHQLALSGPFPAPLARVQREVRDTLVGLIEQGQRDGSIRPGNPMLLALSVIAQPVYFTLARRVVTQVAGVDQDRPESRDQLIRHALAFIRSGLSAAAGGSNP